MTFLRTRTALSVVGVVALALIAATAYFGLYLVRADRQDDDRRDLVAASRNLVNTLTNLTPDNAEEAVAKLKAAGTGDFLTGFDTQLAALPKLVAEEKVVSTGKVTSIGVVRQEDERAQVLVAVASSISNSSSTEKTPRNYRIQLDLEKRNDRWLVSRLEFVA